MLETLVQVGISLVVSVAGALVTMRVQLQGALIRIAALEQKDQQYQKLIVDLARVVERLEGVVQRLERIENRVDRHAEEFR